MARARGYETLMGKLGWARARGRVRVRVMVRGLLPTTSHSISYTTLNAEGSPSG